MSGHVQFIHCHTYTCYAHTCACMCLYQASIQRSSRSPGLLFWSHTHVTHIHVHACACIKPPSSDACEVYACIQRPSRSPGLLFWSHTHGTHIHVHVHAYACPSSDPLDLQVSYFGLQYQTKSESMRWVDKEKGLRKQLEKYGIHGARNAELRFGVQYYITNVTKLQYEITRYLYYILYVCLVTFQIIRCTFSFHPFSPLLIASDM